MRFAQPVAITLFVFSVACSSNDDTRTRDASVPDLAADVVSAHDASAIDDFTIEPDFGPPLAAGTLSLRSSGYLTGSACEYGEYLPAGYRPDGHQAFVIFMHGIGQDGGTLMNAVYTTGGPMYEMKQGTISMADIPMVVIQPHVTAPPCSFDQPDYLPNFINAAIAFYGLDPNRFFLTGLSEGGGSTNAYLDSYYSISGAPVPAAAVALAAAGEFKNAGTPARLISDQVAWWGGDSIDDAEYAPYGSATTSDVFSLLTGQLGGHYASAAAFPGTTGPYTCYYDKTSSAYDWLSGMVTQLGGVDITPPYLMTLWPGSAHSASWTPMYSNPDLYRWFLAHPRS